MDPEIIILCFILYLLLEEVDRVHRRSRRVIFLCLRGGEGEDRSLVKLCNFTFNQ